MMKAMINVPESPIQISIDESVDVTEVQGLENVPIVVQPTDDSTGFLQW